MKRIKKKLGFTIMELIMVLGLLGVVSVGAGTYISSSFKNSNQLSNKVEVQSSVNALMNKLEEKIKTADIPVFNGLVANKMAEINDGDSFEINQLKQGNINVIEFERTDNKVVSEGVEYPYIEKLQITPYENGAKIEIIGEGNKYSLTSSFYTRNTIGSKEIDNLNVKLAEGTTWYENRTNISKSTIEKIVLTSNYTPIGTESDEWEADHDFSGDIMCYVTNNNELIISGKSGGTIYTNENSAYTFSGFENVKSIENISSLNTNLATNMQGMFENCGVKTLDLSNFTTSNVRNMSGMFDGCSVETLNLSSFNTKNTIDGDIDFTNARNIEKIVLGVRFDSSTVTLSDSSSNWYKEDGTRLTPAEIGTDIRIGPTTYTTTTSVSSYTVNHYLENANDTGYTLYSSEAKTIVGSTITLVNNAITIANSTYKEGKVNGTITENATVSQAMSSGIDLYYTRNTFPLTLQNNGIGIMESDYKWGANVPISAGVANGYTWKGWYYTDGTLYNINQSTTIVMPESALTLNAVSELEIVVATEAPTLAPNSSWYSSTAKTAKSAITQIDIKDSYTPTGTVTESWPAAVDASGNITNDIMCYIEGTKLTIAGNGTGTIKANKDSSCLFNDFTKVTSISGLDKVDTSQATDMSGIFRSCVKLTSLDLSKFNTSKVTDMNSMFDGCDSLVSLDLSSFNTSEVTNMCYMFRGCSSLTSLDLSNFNTSLVTAMDYMFYNCSSLTSLDVSKFNTNQVKYMNNMFRDCSKLTSLDVSNFNTSKVTNMSYMFRGCSKLTSLDLSNFNTSKVTTMSSMFYGCNNLLSLDVSSFNTSKVTNMFSMFNGCSKLTSLDLSSFDTSSVTSMNSGFDGMFTNCSGLTTLDISNFDTSSVTDMSSMFDGCSSLISLDISNFDTSNVKYMYNMFNGCSKLTSLDLSSFDTSLVEDAIGMSRMFRDCSKLKSLDLSNFDTSLVTAMDYMFYNCSSLTSLDLSNFDTSAVTNMFGMFLDMDAIEEIKLGQKFSFLDTLHYLPTTWYLDDKTQVDITIHTRTGPTMYYASCPTGHVHTWGTAINCIKTCTSCGETEVEHVFDNGYEYYDKSNSGCWAYCDCRKEHKSYSHNQDFYTGTVTTAATCTTEGEINHYCSDCKDGYTELIAVIDHSESTIYKPIWSNESLELGYMLTSGHNKVIKCTVCSAELSKTPESCSGESIECKGYSNMYHYKFTKCSMCNHYYTYDMELAHDYDNGTCEDCGWTCTHNWQEGKCTICDYQCAHTFNGDSKITRKSYYSELGKIVHDKEVVCSICGVKYTNLEQCDSKIISYTPNNDETHKYITNNCSICLGSFEGEENCGIVDSYTNRENGTHIPINCCIKCKYIVASGTTESCTMAYGYPDYSSNNDCETHIAMYKCDVCKNEWEKIENCIGDNGYCSDCGQWICMFLVEFDATTNGGTTNGYVKRVILGDVYGELPTATKEVYGSDKYTFNGWYTASSGGKKITASTQVTISEAHTLYAQFTKVDSGSSGSSDGSVTTGGKCLVNVCCCSKDKNVIKKIEISKGGSADTGDIAANIAFSNCTTHNSVGFDISSGTTGVTVYSAGSGSTHANVGIIVSESAPDSAYVYLN